MWLQPEQLGMIVDRGKDWRRDIQEQLDSYGPCWVFRDDSSRLTTRVSALLISHKNVYRAPYRCCRVQARATYKGETRGFEYLTAKVRPAP